MMPTMLVRRDPCHSSILQTEFKTISLPYKQTTKIFTKVKRMKEQFTRLKLECIKVYFRHDNINVNFSLALSWHHTAFLSGFTIGILSNFPTISSAQAPRKDLIHGRMKV